MSAPTSQLQQAIEAFRLALRRAESMAVARTIDAYAPVRANLMALVDALANELTATGTLTAGDVLKLQRARELLAQVEAQLSALGQAITPTIIEAQSAVVGAAVTQAKREAVLSALTDSASLAASVASSWNRLPVNALQALVGSLSDGSPLQAWMSQFGPSTAQAMADALTQGVATGLNPLNVAADLSTVVDVAGTRLAALARTSMLDAYRTASLAQYSANSDILSGWRWVSAQDDTTCAACLDLDGQIFPLDQTFFEAHVNCRCSPAPVLKGEEDSWDRQTGAEFFDSLSPEQQDATLGIAGGQAYRDGEVTLSDFTTQQHDARWGDRYVQDSFKGALASAAARTAEENAA